MLRYASLIYTVIRRRITFVFFILFIIFFLPSLTMYPTVVSATLRLLSNTYPPFPPMSCQPPRRGTVRPSIPESPGSTHLVMGLLCRCTRGTVVTLGKRVLEGNPPLSPLRNRCFHTHGAPLPRVIMCTLFRV